ncbi:hypothetical protein M3644_26730 [Bacillus cereus]|uniref:hypothetical protein n=1 Tax=Bacillus cereus TaxID=1396 RepID=UPI00203FB3C7|nr:hypothetical protein [Bacillus cereus]MCM3223350.1 hypothetical protein [Bacillus cereus]
MRYTRNRQLIKLGRDHKGQKNHSIRFMKEEFFGEELDSTFKWDRRMGRVEWSFVNGNIETTMCALLKYPTVPRWFGVRLCRKENKK